MKVLISNDDGITAPGLHALAKRFLPHNEVYIAAPDRERSAVSRGMTLFDPLRAIPMRLPPLEGATAYAISGTPVDCVRLGLGNLFPNPDIVLSGINLGSNLGTDVLYSGTVSAAHEAALLGYQAIAVSIDSFAPEHLATASAAAERAVAYVQKHPLPMGTLLNVNVPDLPIEEIQGYRTARTCFVTYTLRYVEREDPSGKPYYWPPRGRFVPECGEDTDEYWVRKGYVSLTPLSYDLTDYAYMSGMNVDTF